MWSLASLADDLGRLDYKYKAMLAKAELRLQQLYGRRRGGMQEGQPRPKLPEEVEMERLNEELKEVLERHLARLVLAHVGLGNAHDGANCSATSIPQSRPDPPADSGRSLPATPFSSLGESARILGLRRFHRFGNLRNLRHQWILLKR